MTDEQPNSESTDDVEAHARQEPAEKKFEPAEDVEAHVRREFTEKKFEPTEKKY
jgi:hypothetical protein